MAGITAGTIGPLVGLARGARFSCSIPITAAAVAATTVVSQTATVPGLRTDMTLTVQGPAPATNAALVGARCSAADVLQLDYINPTDGSVSPSSGTHNVVAL